MFKSGTGSYDVSTLRAERRGSQGTPGHPGPHSESAWATQQDPLSKIKALNI